MVLVSYALLLSSLYLIQFAVSLPFSDENNENGKIAVVRLLSQRRSRRDLSKNEYHILEIDIPAKKKNLKVHLIKTSATLSSDMATYVISENGTREFLPNSADSHNDCLYTGTISGDSEGSAALSTCDSNSHGFSGIINSGNETLFILPKLMGSTENLDTSETKIVPEIIHVVHEAKDIVPAGTFSDVLRVPDKEFEAAVKATARQREKYEKNQNQPDHFENNQDTGTLVQPLETNDNSNGFQLENFANKAKKNSQTKKAKTSSTSSNSNSKIVELAIYCDSKFHRNFQKKHPKDTIKQLKAFILSLVNSMSILYKQKSLGLVIQFRLALLEIMKSDPSDLGATSDGVRYLTKFCKYAWNKNSDGNAWDHALIVTGNDIHSDGDKSVGGIAFAGTMCLRKYSCSISEAASWGSVYTISHELGHSMGMEHDGTGISSSCDGETYIMSPSTGIGKTTWSKCSSDNIKTFIATGSSDSKRKRGDATPVCLSKTNKNGKTIKFATNKLPGEVYPIQAQCKMDVGTDYTPYTKGSEYSNVCSMLWCGKPKGSSISIRGAHPALEGTSCSSGKKCRAGQCT